VTLNNGIDDRVAVIDTATSTVVATTTNIVTPGLVAITPDGAFAYVTSFTGPLTVIDTATNAVTASFAPPLVRSE